MSRSSRIDCFHFFVSTTGSLSSYIFCWPTCKWMSWRSCRWAQTMLWAAFPSLSKSDIYCIEIGVTDNVWSSSLLGVWVVGKSSMVSGWSPRNLHSLRWLHSISIFGFGQRHRAINHVAGTVKQSTRTGNVFCWKFAAWKVWRVEETAFKWDYRA